MQRDRTANGESSGPSLYPTAWWFLRAVPSGDVLNNPCVVTSKVPGDCSIENVNVLSRAPGGWNINGSAYGNMLSNYLPVFRNAFKLRRQPLYTIPAFWLFVGPLYLPGLVGGHASRGRSGLGERDYCRSRSAQHPTKRRTGQRCGGNRAHSNATDPWGWVLSGLAGLTDKQRSHGRQCALVNRRNGLS